MIKEVFSDEWKMREVGSLEYLTTKVPATVLSVLLDNGLIEDPFFRDNETSCMNLFEKDYEFSRMFSITGEHLLEDQIELVFYGLDTLTDIYINDEKLASTSNMHRTYRYSIKDKVRAGANELRIVFHSPLRYIQEYKIAGEEKIIDYTPNGCTKGNQYIRKAHASFGWDWGPKLPDIGIFRNVELHAYSKVQIEQVFIDQVHENGQVCLYIDPILKITDKIPFEIVVSVTGQQDVSKVIRMPEEDMTITEKGENELVVVIDDPKYWWPNGIGPQNLYKVKVQVRKSDNIFDEKKFNIGLRTITVSREKDEYGQEFSFVVNGHKIFAFGANYIPEDAVLPRVTYEKTKELIKNAAKANFNCLRVWGGGYYPGDDFYDLCDQYGIIVWQDLMFACNIYELNAKFEKEIIEETRDNVRRIRHHACLGLWCGNNEIEAAWKTTEEFKKASPYLKADYIKMFEYILPKTVKEEDDKTFYWASSPSSGGCFDEPDNENKGDAHYWDVWHGQKSFTDYKNHYFRFLSEFGFQSFPSIKTIESFTEPEDRNIFSYVMEKHQKNDLANGKIMHYLSENFMYPKDFEGVVYVSQLLQGMAIKYGVEHLRRNRGRCMGTLYWQFNDNWPVASWSSVDYYGRWKALHYMAKQFYQPLCGSLVRVENKEADGRYIYKAYVVNDSFEDVSFTIRQTLYDMDGKEIVRFEDKSRAFSGKVVELKEHDYDRYVKSRGERNVYIQAEFAFNNGKVYTVTETFVPYKYLNLKMPMITYDANEQEDRYDVTITADTFVPFASLELMTHDGVFEDNVFFITPTKPVTISILKEEIKGEPYKDVFEFCDDLDILFLQRTYMNFEAPLESEEDQIEAEENEEENGEV